MPLTNTDPRPKDVVIIQRSNDNQSYGEVHISASRAIFHIDTGGYVNVDELINFLNDILGDDENFPAGTRWAGPHRVLLGSTCPSGRFLISLASVVST